ncbi:hypothetical protein AB0H18_19135 [Streptomyces sp. NPDC020766]|uniref:hypothetical protein n=1 Tax=Streptomyces sp. NPDC020766 TaxID=3155011 RepID=UPI0033D1C9B0
MSIGRFVAAAPPDGERRVAQLAGSVVRHDLATALAEADVPAGIWCLRRLDVQVGLDLDDTDAALGRAWAGTLVSQLLQALAHPGSEVVHYLDPVQAVADLIASTSLGQFTRAWAWARAGVRERADPDPERSPGEAIVVSLRRLHGHSPRASLASLLESVRRVGLAPLHRVLGGPQPRSRGDGWIAVADLIAPVSSPVELPVAADATGHLQCRNIAAPPPAPGHAPATPGPMGGWPKPSAPQQFLADELLGRSHLASAITRSRLRPDELDAIAWAQLVLAEADPSALCRPAADGLLRAVAAAWMAPIPAAPKDAATPSTSPSEATAMDAPVVRHPRPGASPAAHAPNSPASAHEDTGAPPDFGPAGRPTAWAGLLFLLNLAPALRLPHTVLADDALARRSLSWVLQAVAVALLPLPSDDPALAAFAGLSPAQPAPLLTGPPAVAAELHAVHELADRWARAAASALGRPAHEGAATVRALAARRGTVVFSPGWIEVVFALDEVDIDVRIAGLDLDPGWVPWLGCVMRYRYA